MASQPSFNSWEPTWLSYGHVVYAVAGAVEPSATKTELAAQVTTSAAEGFLDTETIDPLAALLVELLRNRSLADRLVAAQSLVHLGIPTDRAADVTTTATANAPRAALSKIRHHTEPATNIPTFEQVRSKAIVLWAQRLPAKAQSLPFDQTLAYNPFKTVGTPNDSGSRFTSEADRILKRAAERDEVARSLLEQQKNKRNALKLLQAKRRRRNITAAGFLTFLVGGMFAGGLLGPRLLDRVKNDATPPLLSIKDLPKQWALTFAAAHRPANALNPTTVFQRFDSRDKRRTVLVTTMREDTRFGDASLGTPRQVDRSRLAATTMKSQAEATASDSFPVHSPANSPVMMVWKQPLVPFTINQAETLVYLEAYGIPSRDLRDLGRSLSARPKLLENGWSTPEGFTEQITVPPRAVQAGIQSSLIIKSTLDGKTRVMLQMHRAQEAGIATDDLRVSGETLTLPSGRVVKFSRGFTHGYSWTESGYEFSATIFRHDKEESYGGGVTQQTKWLYNFIEPLPNRHLDGVLDLLDRVRLGNDEQWRALTAGHQASLQKLPSLGTVQIGGHQIVTRTLPNGGNEKARALRIPYTFCAYSVCTHVYTSWDGLTREADLLIDDHWWHFRQIAKYDKRIPKYFTSPAVESFQTSEASFDRVYKWWGIDLGTKASAARNEAEPTLLLRPLPR